MFLRRKKGRRVSRREQISGINAIIGFYAEASDKPGAKERAAALQRPIPRKREVRRPVDGRPVGPTEHQEQSSVIAWWAKAHPLYNIPEFALFAIPNGGARDIITGAKLKREGVRRGVFDLMLAYPTPRIREQGGYAGLFIEMKVGDNKPSDDQKKFQKYLEDIGYKAVVHWSAEAAINEIQAYLA